MAYSVYVLLNLSGEIYVGQSEDVPHRLSQHNDPAYHGSLHTKRHAGPWRVVHEERFSTRREAMRRERELKSSRGRAWLRRQIAMGC